MTTRPTSLDVVIPTYNRSHMVVRTVNSLFRATRPEALNIKIIVVDNNSTDDTAAVIRQLQVNAPIPLLYRLETRQGSSAARNAGVAAGSADLIGFVDDDEQVDEGWLCAIDREFLNPETSYIGGPCLADRAIEYPHWLPPGYHSVIGVSKIKPRAVFGPDHPGMLNGGNAVLRRSVLTAVGEFAVHLGRSAKHLLSEEDAEFFERLQKAKFRGLYVPELVILHYVDPLRLTRRYHRRWAFWRAVSQGVLDRQPAEEVRYALGVPRYRIGRALRGLWYWCRHRNSHGQGRAFARELACWDLAGFVYGKFLFREQNHYATRAVAGLGGNSVEGENTRMTAHQGS